MLMSVLSIIVCGFELDILNLLIFPVVVSVNDARTSSSTLCFLYSGYCCVILPSSSVLEIETSLRVYGTLLISYPVYCMGMRGGLRYWFSLVRQRIDISSVRFLLVL